MQFKPFPAHLLANTIPSISAYAKHGIKRSTLHHMLLNHFTFPLEFRDLLNEYFILHWESSHLKEQLKDGIIPRYSKDGSGHSIEYIVLFRRPIKEVLAHKDVKLSFRRAKEEYNLPAYVIVEPLV